ncbi:MAG TPA: RNB domain-containing ribonuclease [Candidatus Poseidoniales archaeon]|nr:RNB domain-containing ribonuclease [Candidatus Poseidoniales archaeon]
MRPKKKGREDPPEHRLFRRLRGHGLDGESNLEQILELIRSKESNLKLNEKQLRSQIQETLVHALRKGELFIGNAQSFELRDLKQVEEIEANVRHWRDLGSNDKQDELLDNAFLSLLKSEKFSDDLSLAEGEVLRTWLGFELVKQIKTIAIKRSGLRFQDPLVCMAWLMREEFKPEELLDFRLKYRQKQNDNPFPRQYRQDIIDHANTLPEPTLDEDRVDLRHLPFVTIDPPDAKDFDDAICFQNDTLWVAIADVAHYVKPGTALDRYALSRATSVYLPHCVLPMLPPRLADDLCSLNAGVDKYAMVIEMKIEDATVVSTKAHQALIKVSENLSYSEALVDERFQDLITLSKEMHNRRIGLDIAGAEMRPRINPDGIELEVKWPNDATRMIEAFMVATNEAVGHLLGKEEASLPWRCHSPPDRPEVESLNAKLAALDVGIELPMPSHRKTGQSESDETLDLLSAWAGLIVEEEVVESNYLSSVIDSEARGEILISLREAQYKANSLSDSHKRVVDQGLFQLMQRAIYSEENFGHFGLDLDAYVHFTSPIRRYPDLIVHRQLKAFLAGDEPVHSIEEVAEMSEHCSMRSTQAKRLEWELVASTCNMHLMKSDEETSWNARVVGLRTPWIFLDLEDDGSFQGRMHLAQLGGKERLFIDEHGLKVERQSGEVILELGQRFNCRLRGLDIWSGALDLAPI